MSDLTDSLLSDILAFIGEVNRGDAAAALARFTEDVCIVEDLSPFRMTGPDAGQRWLAAMGGNAQKLGVTSVACTQLGRGGSRPTTSTAIASFPASSPSTGPTRS